MKTIGYHLVHVSEELIMYSHIKHAQYIPSQLIRNLHIYSIIILTIVNILVNDTCKRFIVFFK